MGAGDAFGVVLTLRLASGDRPSVAGRAAAAAAARVVEGPGLGTLPGGQGPEREQERLQVTLLFF